MKVSLPHCCDTHSIAGTVVETEIEEQKARAALAATQQLAGYLSTQCISKATVSSPAALAQDEQGHQFRDSDDVEGKRCEPLLAPTLKGPGPQIKPVPYH